MTQQCVLERDNVSVCLTRVGNSVVKRVVQLSRRVKSLKEKSIC